MQQATASRMLCSREPCIKIHSSIFAQDGLGIYTLERHVMNAASCGKLGCHVVHECIFPYGAKQGCQQGRPMLHLLLSLSLKVSPQASNLAWMVQRLSCLFEYQSFDGLQPALLCHKNNCRVCSCRCRNSGVVLQAMQFRIS